MNIHLLHIQSIRFALALCAAGVSSQSISAPADTTRFPSHLTETQVAAAQKIPDLKAIRVDARGVPSYVRGTLGTFRSYPSATRNTDSAALLQKNRDLLRADGSESLRLRKANHDTKGLSHYRMAQVIHGLEVIGGEMILHVDDATSQVVSIDAQFLPGAGLPKAPAVEGAPAIIAAVSDTLGGKDVELQSEPRIAYSRGPDAQGHLVWAARVRYTSSAERVQIDEILVDAVTGEYVRRLPKVQHALYREVRHYATNALVVAEGGGSSADLMANYVYEYSGDTYNFFWNSYGRDSWDGAGTPMLAYVHGTPAGQNNAVYDSGATYYGDGDWWFFMPLGYARDVVGHEWTHGVTESEANLDYFGESGGLNESMSDIFGAAVEVSREGVYWNTFLVGEDVFTPGIDGDALRYMADPAFDGGSRDYYPDLMWWDDPHYSSGIGNLAFYLLSEGGTHPRDKTSIPVSGIGFSNAARIFYLTLANRLQSSDGYVAASEKMGELAEAEYGHGSAQHVNACYAWQAVGVPASGVCSKPQAPTPITVDKSACPTVVVSWPAVPHATEYALYRRLGLGRWIPNSSGPTTSRRVNVPIFAHFTVNACNALGCSELSPSVVEVRCP